MITPVDPFIEAFCEAGADHIIVHAEAGPHLHRTLQLIRSRGRKPGVALNPGTPVEHALWVLDMVDSVLVMTVNPGFGGQSFLDSQLPKIAALRRAIDASGPRRSRSRWMAASRRRRPRAAVPRAPTSWLPARRCSARRTTRPRSRRSGRGRRLMASRSEPLAARRPPPHGAAAQLQHGARAGRAGLAGARSLARRPGPRCPSAKGRTRTWRQRHDAASPACSAMRTPRRCCAWPPMASPGCATCARSAPMRHGCARASSSPIGSRAPPSTRLRSGPTLPARASRHGWATTTSSPPPPMTASASG